MTNALHINHLTMLYLRQITNMPSHRWSHQQCISVTGSNVLEPEIQGG